MESLINLFKIAQKTKKVSVADYDAGYSADYNKEDALQILGDLKKELGTLQEKLYATKRFSMLVIFQAMDAAGKDSVIEHVMSGINPQGCIIYSFKQPSLEELEHDFLWRHHKAQPERGFIAVHNRSHYENVLVCKVHPELVLNEVQNHGKSVDEIDEEFWSRRYESIRDFEKHLSHNGTVILKFFLNVSKKEQKKRFLDRIADPEKNWKFSAGDLKERKLWDMYMQAYEKAIEETADDNAPWYVIPADKKWFSRIAIAKIMVEKLKDLDLSFPKISKEETQILQTCKDELLKED